MVPSKYRRLTRTKKIESNCSCYCRRLVALHIEIKKKNKIERRRSRKKKEIVIPTTQAEFRESWIELKYEIDRHNDGNGILFVGRQHFAVA